MKSKFPAYYRIHREDLLKRFSNCVFVFDASSLLDIFRLREDVTQKVFDVISKYKSQIRVPYHAAEEYNKRIHTVLLEQISKISASKAEFDKFTGNLEAKRNQPYISKKSNDLLVELKKQIYIDFQEQEDHLKQQLLYGEYQNKMADLLDGCVLEPFSQEEIERIQAEGIERYQKQIPPGWKDASKDDNRYGDLINWKEILRFAKESKQSIIFIANDEKADWICKEQGMTIGPLYELLKEFYKETADNNQLLYIYTLDRFLDFVNEHDSHAISKDIVDEVRVSITPESMIQFRSSLDKFTEALHSTEFKTKLDELSKSAEKVKQVNYFWPQSFSSAIEKQKEDGTSSSGFDDKESKDNHPENRDD